MTDYTDLIARLRDAFEGDSVNVKNIALRKSADALEAQARRIAELEEAPISFVKKQTDDKIDLYDAQYYMRQRIAELEAALREAYEVYAGSDGFIAETAAEGYLQQLISEMVAIIGAGLERKNESL